MRQVRLIDENSEQQGIIDTREAMDRARAVDLDLVMVGESADPPVAKIMDYGKFRYEEQQKKKEARKRSRSQDLKSIKFRIKVGDHDFNTKVNHIRRFIKGGHKVKATIMFRGRERAHPELGQQLLQRVADEVQDVAAVETKPNIAGMDMNMVLVPAANAPASKDKPRNAQADAPKAEEAKAETTASNTTTSSTTAPGTTDAPATEATESEVKEAVVKEEVVKEATVAAEVMAETETTEAPAAEA